MQLTLRLLQATVAVGALCVRSSLSRSARLSMTSTTGAPDILQIKRLSEHAVIPTRGSEHAAGFDLSSAQDARVLAGRQALIKTDLSIAIPPNTYARIAPRSGLAMKKMIDVGAGVIDFDYRGPVGIVLFNHGSEDFQVNKGDRIAQLILERICMAQLEEVTELSETSRGNAGFGSTGVERNVPTDITNSIANGCKKLKLSTVDPILMHVLGSKSSRLEGAEYVKYLLQLIGNVSQILDKRDLSGYIMKLRKCCLGGKRVAGDALEAALDAYQRSEDLDMLAHDVTVIADELCN